MSRYNEQNNFDFLDMLAILAFIIQVLDYETTLAQAGNDNILKELRKDVMELHDENQAMLGLLSEIQNKIVKQQKA